LDLTLSRSPRTRAQSPSNSAGRRANTAHAGVSARATGVVTAHWLAGGAARRADVVQAESAWRAARPAAHRLRVEANRRADAVLTAFAVQAARSAAHRLAVGASRSCADALDAGILVGATGTAGAAAPLVGRGVDAGRAAHRHAHGASATEMVGPRVTTRHAPLRGLGLGLGAGCGGASRLRGATHDRPAEQRNAPP
jgi:hypothetical protein